MHGVNVALHGLNALLVYALLRRLTGVRWRSALVAGLFALHPLHVESVAWISERKDVLSTALGLLSLQAYADWAQRAQVPEIRGRCTHGGRRTPSSCSFSPTTSVS